MAQTVKVEIPITATDNTASGVSSAQRRMTGLERVMLKIEKQMQRMSKGRHDINLDAKDNASQKIAHIEDAVNKTGGKHANVEISAHDAATGVLNSVEDATEQLHGEEAVTEISADDSASDVISNVSDEMSELHGEEAVTEISADDSASGVISGVEDHLESVDGKTAQVFIEANDAASDAIGQAGNAARTPIAETAAVMGASFGVYESISTYAGFEAAMSQVQAISGATGKDLEDLTAKAEHMGATTKFTATESAEAFNYMAMAGWKTQEMMSGIDGIMNLAAASGENLGRTSDIVTDALTAFGMSASESTHFADVMAQASANANTNVSMLGESFKYVAPVAGAMKYSIEDTALALGLMANAGVKSSMSGTALRRAITALASPTSSEAAAFEKYGISLKGVDGHQKSLNEVMMDLRQNLGGLAEDQKTAAVSTMFGKQALAGMLAIINASEQDFNKLSEAVNNADGASQQMADTMLDNMQGSFTLMQSAIEGVEDSLGERLAPYMRGLADGITEAMPDAKKAISDIMDTIDVKAGHIKEAWRNMVSTDEWMNAGLGGKVNMAFDTMIVKPLANWAKNEGMSDISGVIGGLFGEAFKVLPGGEKAGLTSWLSAGLLAKGAFTVLPTISNGMHGLTEAVSLFSPVAAGAIPVVAGLAAAFGGLAIASEYMNDKLTQESLDKHFGDIGLTDKQASDIAEGILDAKWGVNLDLAVDKINGADQLRKEAEDALKENDALEYKSRIGIELTADEKEDYLANIDTFINNSLEELSNRSYSAKITVDTMLQTQEGQQLSRMIDKWALEDNIELKGLQEQLSKAVGDALKDGIISTPEEEAINALQMKVSNIMNRWREAQSEAGMDLINEKYGSLSGKDLEAGSFKKVMSELQKHREENDAALDETSLNFHTFLNAADKDGRLRQTGRTKQFYEKQLAQAMAGARAGEMQKSLDFETQTLNDTYSVAINKGGKQAETNVGNAMGKLQSFAPGTLSELSMGQIESGLAVTNADKGLKDLYSSMKPDVQAYEEMIGAYEQQFGKVPKDLMESYNKAMDLGAAAGDKDAAMNVLARQIAQGDDQALKDEIMNLPVGNALREGLERQMVELEENPPTVDGLTAEIENIDAEVTDPEQADSAVKEATEESMDSAGDSGAKAEPTVDVAPQAGETDTSALDEQVQEAAQSTDNAVETESTVNVKASKGSDNIDEVYNQVGDEVKGKFSGGYNADAKLAVKITVDYSIANPSKTVSFSGAGSGSGTITAHMASGGFVDGAMLSLIGEDGPEFVIPVGSKRKKRGAELWAQAGEALGMFDGIPAYAEGGAVGIDEDSLISNPFEKRQGNAEDGLSALFGGDTSNSSGVMAGAIPAAAEGSEQQNNESNSGVSVNVTMNPVIQIDGGNMDENTIFEVMKNRIKEVADDVAYEIGEKAAKIFDNMPVGMEAM